MRTLSSDEALASEGGTSLALSIPVQDAGLFKHSASAPILNFLADNPEFALSVRQLSQVTEVSDRATADAVDALAANGLVEVISDGNARRVHINRSQLHDTGDPIQRIPQVEFRTPVWVAKNYVQDALDGVVGIVIFGSVARGDADRRSDIDLWILVEENLLEQRNEANRLARHLEDIRIPEIITPEDGGTDLEWETVREQLEVGNVVPSAQRYSFEFLIETPKSVEEQSERVDASKLFGSGITLVTSETLDLVKREVLGK